MTDNRNVVAETIEAISPDVHDSWMDGQRTHGRTAAQSRHGTGELMVPYTDLAEVDKDDDRRIVRTVLESLARLPVVDVLRVLYELNGDSPIEVRDLVQGCNPPPDDLAGRCSDAAAREDGQR